MKILFAVGEKFATKPTNELDANDVFTTGTVYNYFLRREMERTFGVETATVALPFVRSETDAIELIKRTRFPEADHFVYLEQRAFTMTHPLIFDALRKRIPGYVTTICDHDSLYGPEDILFHVKTSNRTDGASKSVQLSWAASPEYCFPEKEAKVLNFLIDHRNYSNAPDRSWDVIQEVARFANDIFPEIGHKLGFDRLTVRRFISGGMEIVDTTRPYVEEKYSRRSLSFPDACREYRRCNMFLVTKIESMGLSALECAMSGALVLYPKGFLPENLAKPINTIEWDTNIDFNFAIERLNVRRSALAAARYNWQNLAAMMLGTLRT